MEVVTSPVRLQGVCCAESVPASSPCLFGMLYGRVYALMCVQYLLVWCDVPFAVCACGVCHSIACYSVAGDRYRLGRRTLLSFSHETNLLHLREKLDRPHTVATPESLLVRYVVGLGLTFCRVLSQVYLSIQALV